MGGVRIHKALAGVAVTMIIGGMGMVTAGAVWGAGLHDSQPALRFDTYLRQAVLVIPNPPCPKVYSHCHWMLYVDLVAHPEPHRWVVGTSGHLSLSVDNCGYYQADALVDSGSYYNWKYVTGIRETVGYCPNPSTTSTTGSTKGTAPPPTSSTTSSTVHATVAASSTTPSTQDLPFTASTTVDTAAPTTAAPVADASATLPFTGVDLRPLLVLGSALILLGGLLLSSYESRRRLLRRAAAVRPSNITSGARKASSWFLGL